MRQIKASEVKPGMEVQFDLSGWDVKGTVATVDVRPHAVWIYTEKWCEMSLDLDSPVTVLSEPAPPQPEEPTEFGARVVVDGTRFIRRGGDTTYAWEASFGICFTWDDLLCLGQVTVIPDQGWTVSDAPEVPDQVEEWPGDDTALRKHKWRDRDGDTWSWVEAQAKWECRDREGVYQVESRHPFSRFAPFTRVTARDSAPEVPERIEEWPEDDEHLWAFPWKDSDGWVWKHHGVDDWGWSARRAGDSAKAFTNNNRPCDGPWTRVSDV